MKPGKLFGVGIGPGDPRYLTIRAAEVLRDVAVIFTVISQNASDSVSRAVVESLHPCGEIRQLVFSMSRDPAVRCAQVAANADAILDVLRSGRDCAFATLGDAMTYSTFGYIKDIITAAIPDLEQEIVPGITSFATLSAKSGQVLVENGESLRVIPSFRSEMADTLDFPPHSTTILLKTYRSRKALLARLEREENIEIVYGERLGMDEQFLSRDRDEIAARPETYLSLIMVKKQ
ncbi:MAG: precorrin-2 C(20)-methyltransferase [Bilophila sp.]